MEKKNQKDTNFGIRRTTSMIITCLLVMSGFLVVLPISFPSVESLKYHSSGSAAWEDSDMWDGIPGGPDYNGDPANDGKVTWHAAVNPHIVNADFIVENGYIFEIEADSTVKINTTLRIWIGLGTGATFYSNGTSIAPVTIAQNVSGSFWNVIYIGAGSYGYMEYTMVSGGDTIYVESSTLEMTHSSVGNMDFSGIYAMGSTISVTNTYIANTTNYGIYCDSSDAVIDNSDIYGYNGTDGSPGGIDGGQGIYLTGFSSSVAISNSTIVGGNGGDDISGGGGGAGGIGIFDSYYNGQLHIIDNDLIQGGNGGNNTTPLAWAGNGSRGIYIPWVPNVPPPSVEISDNKAIRGGKGGDNKAPTDGSAGNGGTAIWIADDPPGSAGSAIISNNGEITGGNGGHNYADAVGPTGWTAGNGGDGIFVMDAQTPCSVLIDQNPNIKGGRGGNNTGTGNSFTTAGNGGSGILVWNSNNILITQSLIVGGDGGNNTETGLMSLAGDGGSGVVLWSSILPSFTSADILNSVLIGGEGGDDYVGAGPIKGGPGRGGNGLYSSLSSGTCSSSDLFGGKGGDNYGLNGGGGGGGYGLGISSSFDWVITGGTITGGKGGENFEPTGGGGGGGSAVYIGDNSDNIALNVVPSILGGDGGDANTGVIGPGSAAQATIYATTSTNLDMIRNVITTGIGGYNSSSGSYGQNGTYCFYGTDLGGSIMIMGNDMTTNDKIVITYGIRLNLSLSMISGATISDNDIYNNYYGMYIKDSNAVSIGGNRILNNYNGIYLENSDASIGTGNTIDDNDYGIYSFNSNPTISGDQIVNSSQMGLFFILSNAVVQETSVVNSGVYNVYCNASSPKFYNCTISSPTPGPLNFAVAGNSHPWLLNTTFEKDLTGFGDQLSNITVNWFMHVRVIDVSYNPVNNADVWVNDTYDTNLFYGQTPVDGWINWIIVTEYIENLTGGKYYYTPHNVSAWEGGRFGMNQPTMIKSRFVIVMLDGAAFDIMLKEGWNMISIPVNLTDTTLEEVLKSIDGNYIAVQWYNISDPLDQWKHYHINKVGMNDLANIDRLMGIWILMKTDDILPVVGPIPVPSITDIDLKAGWNFIGYPSFMIRNAGNASGEAFESISGFVDMVQYYDASDPSNLWKAWDYGSYSQDDLIDIKPGYGLWIHVTQDCTWSVDW